MITSLGSTLLRLPKDFDFESEKRAADEGILDGAIIELPNEARYQVYYIGCKRLEEEIERSQDNMAFFARPGMIVVSKVSTWISTLAACWAADQDYFTHLCPHPCSTLVSNKATANYSSVALQEANDRGYIERVDIEVNDLFHFSLSFMVPMRLRYEIEADALNGRPFYIEPGLVVVAQIDSCTINSAVRELAAQGYFGHLRPNNVG